MKALTKAAVQGAACGLVIGTVLLVGQRVSHPVTAAAEAPTVAEVVRARSFELVDKEGKIRASLDVFSFCGGRDHQTQKDIVEWITREPLLSTETGNPPRNPVVISFWGYPMEIAMEACLE